MLHASNAFLFNDPPTSAIYTLSLHDALPIFPVLAEAILQLHATRLGRSAKLNKAALAALEAYDWPGNVRELKNALDRKSTRLNSSHVEISYAVFCLKKKKKPPTLQATDIICT